MRKRILYLLLVAIFVLVCGKEYTRLVLVFGEQPEGGENITEITCVVVGRLMDGDTPIQALVEFYWCDENGQDEQILGYDTWTFRSQTPEELHIYVPAPAGYVLLGYFWFRATWTDEDGTDCEVLSDTAYCYSGE
ncbi:hypothetical protein KAS45_02585 [candidate division WOR-3 bacterium]|nr:hypothetical protein [candidate division WOR-3 bacterium]